jgi:hypothetical protein
VEKHGTGERRNVEFVEDFWITEVNKEEEELKFAEKWNRSFDPLFIGLR